jgi:hypothetical protein
METAESAMSPSAPFGLRRLREWTGRITMLWRMIKTLILIGLSISVALALLQAFLFNKVGHG